MLHRDKHVFETRFIKNGAKYQAIKIRNNHVAWSATPVRILISAILDQTNW